MRVSKTLSFVRSKEENMDIQYEPVSIGKDNVRLAIVRMPDSPDLDEGAVNRLKISVRYFQTGMNRQGRGYYLTASGAAYDGTFESHMLMQDPSDYVLIESCKRFSAKTFEKVVAQAPERMKSTIQTLVENAQRYYEQKGRQKAG